MINRIQALVLATFLLIFSSFSRSEDDFSVNRVLALDEGTVFSLETCTTGMTVYRLQGKKHQELFSITTPSRPVSPRIIVHSGEVTLAWLEAGEDGNSLELRRYSKGEIVALSRPVWEKPLEAVLLEKLEKNSFGLLLLNGETGSWFESDLDQVSWSRRKDIVIEGMPYSLSMLTGKEKWLAWQEKNRNQLQLAVTRLDIKDSRVIRKDVSGFGGSARPALLALSEPAVAWQDSRDDRAVIKASPLKTFGASEEITLELPEGVSGLLSPEIIKGSLDQLSCYGVAEGQWVGIKYSFGKEVSSYSSQLRVAGSSQVLDPAVVQVRGKEIWIWDDGQRKVLSGEEFQYVLNIRPDQEQFECLPDDAVRILAWGDSITAGKSGDEGETTGYIPFLNELYSEKVEPANIWQSGRSSETTLWGLIELQSALDRCNYDFVLILEGTNDMFRYKLDDPSLEVEDTAANLIKMAEICRKDGAIPIVGTLLPKHKTTDMNYKVQGQIRSIYIKPAMRLNGITVCDFQSFYPFEHDFKKPSTPGVFTRDYYNDTESFRFTHPSQLGYEIMGRLWFQAMLTFQGDVNRDYQVDEADLLLFNVSMDSRRGEISFNPDCDFNDDGKINVKDMTFLISRMGKTWKEEE